MKYHLSKNRLLVQYLHVSILCLVTVIYTWPLLSKLTVAIPGRFDLTDTTETIFSVGWVRQALLTGANVWHTDRLFVPQGADLRFNVFGLFQGLMAYPFISWFGVVGASNLVIILTMCLNGIFAYHLVWRHTNHQTAALLASTCQLLSLSVVWHFSAGRNALPSLWIVSGSLLCLKILSDRPSIQSGVLFGCFLLAALFTDLQILAFTLLWSMFYMSAYFWRNGLLKSLPALFVPGLTAAVIFATAFGTVLVPALPPLTQGELRTPSLDDAASHAFSIKDFVSPREIPYIYGFDFLVSTILAAVFFKWQGEYRFWLIGSLFFLVLSLGPYLIPTQIPLPYALASIWPSLLNFRAVYRFVIPASVGLTLVMGYVLAFLFSRPSRNANVIVVCAAFILLRLLYTIHIQPFETHIYPSYNVYQNLAMDSSDYVIMEIPFGIRSGFEQIGQGGERLQFYQHVHGKRILNGSLARLPHSLIDFYRSHPILLFFSGDMSFDHSELDSDFSEVVSWAKPEYILMHGSLLTTEQRMEIELFLDRQGQFKKVEIEDDLVVYKKIP